MIASQLSAWPLTWHRIQTNMEHGTIAIKVKRHCLISFTLWHKLYGNSNKICFLDDDEHAKQFCCV